MKKRLHTPLLVAASLAAFGTAHAAFVINGVSTSLTTDNSAAAGFATQATYAGSVVNNDLINSGTSTFSSATIDKTPFAIAPQQAALNDGLDPASPNACYLPTTFGSGGKMPFTYTVTLNTTVNTLGYDITGINSFAGWNQNGCQLADQNYDVFVRQVGGSTYTLIGSVTYSPFTAALGTNNKQAGASKVSVTDDTGKMASGVNSIRFVFKDTAAGANPILAGLDGTVYNEVDVIGSATAVPEPSTYGLIGASTLAVATVVRRRRRAL